MWKGTCRNESTGNTRKAARGVRGQSVLEYSILVAIVAAAFIAMSLYVRRAVQGRIYSFDDMISAKPNQTSSIWWGGYGGAGSGGWVPW